MANDDLKTFTCPVGKCHLGLFRLNVEHILTHILYHAAWEVYENDARIFEEEGDTDTIDVEQIIEFKEKGYDVIEFRKMALQEIWVGLCLLPAHVQSFMRLHQKIWQSMLDEHSSKENNLLMAVCEICSKTFCGNNKSSINTTIEQHRSLKHYDKLLEHTFYKRRTEPDANQATYCGADVETGPCGKKVGGEPESNAEIKILVHQKLAHPKYICTKPFVPPAFQ